MILTKQKIELTIKDINILHEQIAKPIAKPTTKPIQCQLNLQSLHIQPSPLL